MFYLRMHLTTQPHNVAGFVAQGIVGIYYVLPGKCSLKRFSTRSDTFTGRKLSFLEVFVRFPFYLITGCRIKEFEDKNKAINNDHCQFLIFLIEIHMEKFRFTSFGVLCDFKSFPCFCLRGF